MREAPPMDLGGSNPTAQMNHSRVLLTTMLAVVALLMQGGGLQRTRDLTVNVWWPPQGNLAAMAFSATMTSTAAALLVWGPRVAVAEFPVNMVVGVTLLHGVVVQWVHGSFAGSRRDIEELKKKKYNYKSL
jgi:hypothetical protein